MNNQGASSSSLTQWKWLWNLSLPPKVKLFTWRLIKGLLPTRADLIRRKITTDGICQHCGNSMETTEHLFRDCEWSMHFWYSSCLRVNIKENESRHNLADWIFKIKSQLPSEGTSLFFTFLWYIWYARNVLVHEKKIIQIMDCHRKALSILFEYQEANQKTKPHPEINVGKY